MRHAQPTSPRIGVIGGGISGLTAAYLLSKRYEVTLFEAANRLGGHTYTVPVETERGSARVDMGFIVFNERNYPLFVRLLRSLGVDSQPSEMSFSVRSERSGVEYRSTSLDSLFSQRRNLLSPSFYRLLSDIVRFNRKSRELLGKENGGEPTLEEYVRAGRFSPRFWEEYLVPMGSAIWSAAPESMRRFPASYLVRFFANHGFLDSDGGLPWRTIRGGSDRYLNRIVAPFADRIRLGTPVRGIRRHPDRVELHTDKGTFSFDHVVIATHSDQALAMLKDPTRLEEETLSEIPYQTNDVALHTDRRALPRNRRAWASWNYVVPQSNAERAHVTYYSNRLQSIESAIDFCVTLNRTDSIRAESLLERVDFHHPIYSSRAIEAHAQRASMNGRNRTSFCGAYWGYGFHEDGVRSAFEAVAPFGVGL
jgi:predicted NAD/FAD-binding protein